MISKYLDKLDACLSPKTRPCDRLFFEQNAMEILRLFEDEVARETRKMVRQQAANDKKLDIEEVEQIYRKLPTRQILFVEDGSVDLDELKAALHGTNIIVIVYRQGSKMPQLVNLQEEMIKKL